MLNPQGAQETSPLTPHHQQLPLGMVGRSGAQSDEQNKPQGLRIPSHINKGLSFSEGIPYLTIRCKTLHLHRKP